MDKREGWLRNLTVGDKVTVSRISDDEESIHEVQRVTPTGRIVVNGVRYEPDGWVYLGGVWNKTRLIAA